MEKHFKLLKRGTPNQLFSGEETMQEEISIISQQNNAIIEVIDDRIEEGIFAEDESYSKQKNTVDKGTRKRSPFVIYEDDAETENLCAKKKDDVVNKYDVKDQKAVAEQTSASDFAEYNKVCTWIVELLNNETRINALTELAERYALPYLGPMLWNSFGTITVLLQEVMNIYPEIFPPTLSFEKARIACNAIVLLQCVASHPETKMQFLAAWIPFYIIPFLKHPGTTEAMKFVQVGCLGCIAGMIKPADTESVVFLLSTDIILFSLRTMEEGSYMCKILATFIMERILQDNNGLAYMCNNYYRFREFTMVLGKMVISIAVKPEATILKLILKCYIRLSMDPKANTALRTIIPDQLKDNTFTLYLQDDVIKSLLTKLLTDLELE